MTKSKKDEVNEGKIFILIIKYFKTFKFKKTRI